MVTNIADRGPGTLRQRIVEAAAGDILTILSSTISSNSALMGFTAASGRGGDLYNGNGTAIVRHCTLAGNVAAVEAIGIFQEGANAVLPLGHTLLANSLKGNFLSSKPPPLAHKAVRPSSVSTAPSPTGHRAATARAPSPEARGFPTRSDSSAIPKGIPQAFPLRARRFPLDSPFDTPEARPYKNSPLSEVN